MKINFLVQEIGNLTGGTKYDGRLYEELRAFFSTGATLLQDKDFIENQSDTKTINYKMFSHQYKKYASLILQCDYLFINSRLYTRFFNFPWNGFKNTILIHHHFDYMTRKGIKKIIHKHLELSFLKRAKYIVTPNPYTFDQLKRIGFEKRTVLLDSFLFKTKNFNIVDAKDNTILFIGTVEPRKGLNYGIQAFAKFVKDHPTYSFIIAGNIPYESYFEELKLLISDLKIEDKIVFLGRVSDVEKDKLYRNSRVFLFPSQNEGYGHVLIEAMSYGLPVIAFNNTAMPYTVNEENGFLVSNKNIYEMSDALSKLIDEKELWCSLSNGALNTIKKLPEHAEIHQKYSSFFESLLNGKIEEVSDDSN